MMSLVEATATELLQRLQTRQITAVELTQAYLQRIERWDGQVRAFLQVEGQAALERAAEIDRRREAGQPLGRLAGLPVALKDLICTEGQPTSCASKMLADFRPPYDAAVVERLKQADAILIGKTNMDEFAMGSTTETSVRGPTSNPWDLSRVPGGSSGGGAACVAARMAPLSVGTDTGGSIRQPAAFCGITGLKPTYGRVSRYGLIAFASSLDQIGPLARTAEDAALLLEVLAGHDSRDSTSAPVPCPAYSQTVSQPLDGLTLGVVREHFGEGLDSEVEAAVREAMEVYRSRGARLKEISLPHNRYAIATYYVIGSCEASSNLARYDGAHYGYRTDEHVMRSERAAGRPGVPGASPGGEPDPPLVDMYRRSRAEGFGAEVKRRVMLGTYALSHGYYDAYYLKALQVRRLIRNDFDRAFQEVDLIAGPVTPTPPYPLGEKLEDPLAMYLGDLYTASANLAGITALAMPCGFSREGLPLGLQLQGPPLAEERVLRAAAMYQAATDWHQRHPAGLG